MKKKLSKHGNSFAIVIDKPILQLLGITEKTQLELRIEGKKIIIEQSNKKQDRAFEDIVDEILKQYEPALKKLAYEN